MVPVVEVSQALESRIGQREEDNQPFRAYHGREREKERSKSNPSASDAGIRQQEYRGHHEDRQPHEEASLQHGEQVDVLEVAEEYQKHRGHQHQEKHRCQMKLEGVARRVGVMRVFDLWMSSRPVFFPYENAGHRRDERELNDEIEQGEQVLSRS